MPAFVAAVILPNRFSPRSRRQDRAAKAAQSTPSARGGDRDRRRRCEVGDRERGFAGHECRGAGCVEGRLVIGPTGAVRVMVATKPVDFRKGAEGMAALVRENMGADPVGHGRAIQVDARRA